MRVIIEQGNADLSSHSDLVLAGITLIDYMDLDKSVNPKLPQRHGIFYVDVLRNYIGLLSLGKSDFKTASGVQEDDFFRTAV